MGVLKVRVAKFIRPLFLLGALLGYPMTVAWADTDPPAAMLVDDVKIEGNRLISTEEITAVMKTHKGDKYDRDQVFNDLKAIDGLGYFNKNSLQVNPEVTPSGLQLKIRVEENAPITQFAITGNNAISTEEISNFFADQLGRPANLNALASAITKVEETYRQRGFAIANVTDVKDDPDGSVDLVINEGIIDSVVIIGNKKTQDYVIRNSLKLKPGSVYDEKQLTNDLRKLYSYGYFQDIRRSVVPSEKDPAKFTLKIDVDEKRTGSVNVCGCVATLAAPFSWLDFSDNNFRGKGQVLPVSTQIGSSMPICLTNIINNGGSYFLPTGRAYSADVSWIEPSWNGTDTTTAVTGFAHDMASMAISQSLQQTSGVTTNLSKPLDLVTTFSKFGASASKFVPPGAETTLPMKTALCTLLGGTPQFDQYRLGGVLGNRFGFKSFTQLGTGSTMLMGTLELRRKLHLPGDNVINSVINNNVRITSWVDYGQMIRHSQEPKWPLVGVRGASPFYFDQYLQGAKSANFEGDVKIPKWLGIGGGYGYSQVENAAYAKTLTAAFGPNDLKLLINRDVLNNVNRFGFDILFGQPMPFSKGNFPTRGVGWRMGKAVAEPPFTQRCPPGPAAAFSGEIPWVY